MRYGRTFRNGRNKGQIAAEDRRRPTTVEVAFQDPLGYLPGDPGETEGEYILRDKHYHTWPQVYLAGHGWIDLEATPTGEGSRVAIETPWVAAGTAEEYPSWGIPDEWQLAWMYGLPYDYTLGETIADLVASDSSNSHTQRHIAVSSVDLPILQHDVIADGVLEI